MKTILSVIILQVIFCMCATFNLKGDEPENLLSAKTTSTCMDSSDFEQVVKATPFIDKTMLIKDIFLSAKMNLITAPRKFGKTTNLDMVKRFLEIDIDPFGYTKNVTMMSNYNLFKENNLEISKDDQFFSEHFGKHPVIHIDYSPLREINNYEDMIKEFRKIVTNTLGEHAYLVKNKTIWKDKDEKRMFVRYITQPESKKLKIEKLHLVFKWLSKLLNIHFSKKVFVLIDECDAFVYSLIYNSSSDLSEMSRFMLKTEKALLVSNEHVGRALITGVFRTYRGDYSDNIYDYHFLEDYQFSYYYGLTEYDLDTVLGQVIENDKKKEETKISINDFYGGYKIYNRTGAYTNIYCIWSVLYFITHHNYITDYLCTPEYLNEFHLMFRSHKVHGIMDLLLSGREVYTDLREPFYKEDIIELNNLVRQGNNTVDVRPGTFVRFLYSLGYLTPIKDNNGFSEGKFKIPNKDTFNQLKKYINTWK